MSNAKKDRSGQFPDPHPTDIYVGRQLCARRVMLGFSQERLATAIGLTFQQVQKYERGVNRISASRLYDLGKVLDVPVSYFFEGLEEETKAGGLSEDAAEFGRPDLEPRETLELVRVFKTIQSPAVRRRVLSLVRSVASSVETALKEELGETA